MNNVNYDFPALMSDGRYATDYRPSCVVNSLIMKQNGLSNSHQERMFLQHNAEQLQALNIRNFNYKAAGGKPCFHVDPNGHDAYWRTYKASLMAASMN
jgi:hypothetical protein